MNKFLFKGISVLGAMLLFATSVMPGLQYAYAQDTEPTLTYDLIYNSESCEALYPNDEVNCDAEGEDFPWAVIKTPEGGLAGTIVFEYAGEEDQNYTEDEAKAPFGKHQEIAEGTYLVQSIPAAFDDETLKDDGFVSDKLKISYIPESITELQNTDWYFIDNNGNGWDNAYGSVDNQGPLYKYYAKHPEEGVWCGGRSAVYTDRHYTGILDDNNVETSSVTWESDTVQGLTIGGTQYYAEIFYDFEPRNLPLYSNSSLTESTNKTLIITSITYAGECSYSWKAITNLPWIVGNLNLGESTAKFEWLYKPGLDAKDRISIEENAIPSNNYRLISVSDRFENVDDFDVNNFSVKLIATPEAEPIEITKADHKYTVTFDENGVEEQNVELGLTATEPTDPTKEGYVFLGWFEDGATSPYDFTTPVTADVDLTAEWVLESNVVTFITSNSNPLPVVFDADNNNSIDLESTKALFKKLPAPTNEDDALILTYILGATSTDGAEIYQIGNEYVLFFNVKKAIPALETTKAFRQDGSVLFNADSFKNNETNTDATVISYDLSKAIAPTWVDKNGAIKSYNEVKDGEVVIGYTFHTNTKYGWFYAPAKYNVTFVDEDGTTELKAATAYAYGTKTSDIALPENLPTKAADSTCNTYELGWTPALADVTADVTYKAKFTCTSKKSSGGSYSGGGGGGSSRTTTTDDTAKTETGSSVDTTEKVDSTNADTETKEENNGAAQAETYSDELVAAYKWAYGQGITTMPTIQKAKLNDSITREQLAKMMVQFMSKVLDKKPIKSDVPNYADVTVQSRGQEMYDFVTLAYQYQIMGIDANGNALKKFKPTGTVSRAEFATVLSRVLFGDTYNQNSGNYRELHIQALNTAGILNNTNPTITELRGWILLMLYRSRDVKIELKAKDTPVAEAPAEETTPAAQSDESKGEESEGTGAMIGMPNPASVYCEEQGGTLSIVKDAEGNESGMCKLADGTEVEEWAYYRANHADEAVSAQEAKPAEESSTSEETKSE